MPLEKEYDIGQLNEKIMESYAHVENNFNKFLNEIQEILEDIASESEKFVGSGETFLEQFGSKVATLVLDIKKPDKINLQNIATYINSLDMFHRKLIYYGARWLRKTGPMHKLSIGQIERKRRKLLELTKSLTVLFSNYQDELKNWKRAENIVRKMSKLEEEKAIKRRTLEELDSKLKEVQILIEKEEKEMQLLTQKEDFVEARDFKKKKGSFEEQVKTELKHLEKPVLKSLKLVEDKSITTDQQKIIALGRLVNDPRRALLDLENVKNVEEALIFLRELLKNKRLNLKSSRKKKALDTISSLMKEGKISEYSRKFNEYAEQNRKLEVEGVMGKTKELEEIKKENEENKEALVNLIKEKKRIEEDIISYEESVGECFVKLEELIQK